MQKVRCIMITPARPVEPERVACEICLKEVPRSEAAVSETRDYVMYFCGLDCYEKWQQRRDAPEPEATEAEIQLGHGRSKVKDERMKRIIRQHPQRDEPKVDSVEPDETSPP